MASPPDPRSTGEAGPIRRAGRPPRERTAEEADVRARLLDAATALAIERGFDNSSIREIADRAGVSSGMIQYYFGGRRGLYEAMFDRAFDRLAGELAAAIESLPEGADSLETLIRVHTGAIAANPWIPQLLAREVLAGEGGMRAHFQERVGEGPLALIRHVIEDGIARGRLRADLDPTLCVITLGSLSTFPFLIAPVVGERLGIEIDAAFCERLVDHNLALLARGLRARDEESP